MTKIEKLLQKLENGQSLTVKQIQTKIGLANPTAAVNTLRQHGYDVVLEDNGKTRKYAIA